MIWPVAPWGWLPLLLVAVRWWPLPLPLPLPALPLLQPVSAAAAGAAAVRRCLTPLAVHHAGCIFHSLQTGLLLCIVVPCSTISMTIVLFVLCSAAVVFVLVPAP